MVLEEMNFRYNCGYLKETHLITLDDKYKMIKTIWLYHVFKKVHTELDQLQMGIRDTLMMESFAIMHPKELLVFFVSSSLFDITSSFFLDCHYKIFINWK